MSEIERLLRHITFEPNTGCWLWTAHCDKSGYGQVKFRGRTTEAHRAVFIARGGIVIAGLDLDHTCTIRSCANPEHLDQVTHAVNMWRSTAMAGVNKRKTVCLRGHPFDEENTRPRLLPNGQTGRSCITCEHIRNSARREAA